MRILKQSHSAEKHRREDPLKFLKLQFAAKYQKIEGRTLWKQKNQKSRTVPKQMKGGHFSLFWFCMLRLKSLK